MEQSQHVHDLVAAYAVDAVSPEEARQVEAHLATCATCRQLVGELRDVTSYLPSLTTELAPPAALKTRLMEIVTAESTNGRIIAQDSAVSPQLIDFPALNGARRQTTDVSGKDQVSPGAVGRSSRPMRLQPRRTRLLVILAALVALVVASEGILLSNGGSPAAPTAAYAMSGTVAQPAISGTLDYYKNGQRLVLHVHGLKILPSGQSYELWLIRGQYRLARPIGSFLAGSDGRGQLTVTGQRTSDYVLACLTVEQTRQPQKPTLPLVALATINH